MEDNTTKTSRCVKGCGFFGNPTTNNMCSKCFKGTSNKNGQNANNITSTTSTNQINLPLTTKFEGSSAQTNTTATAEQVVPLTTTTITANNGESITEVITTTTTTTTTTASASLQTSTAIISSSPDARPIQKNKASCYTCRAKIPLAKQTINKCRCEYVYCDNHKVPNKHDCDFDFAKMGKDILAKNNPKLNDVHKGGRSFNRID